MPAARDCVGVTLLVIWGGLAPACQTETTAGPQDASAEVANETTTTTTGTEVVAIATETTSVAELPVTCRDDDGDGLGVDCSAGPDCDDTRATCTMDCADEDGDQRADCAVAAPRAVFLYDGSNGGGPDSSYEGPLEVFTTAGIPVDHGTTLPGDVATRFGILVFLNPRDTLPESVLAAARQIVRHGGRVVSFVDHSGYGAHAVGATLLARVGSSMHSEPTLKGGSLDLTMADVSLLAEGVASLEPFFSASVAIGDGIAFGVTDDGFIAVGYEEVGPGDVVVVGDSSMLGYALEQGGNRRFVANLANLRVRPE